ncbi:keratin, type II cytoskeletal 3-like [Sphaerodactylus townsendi]|uniref:keratin, type II cytoskeletal 3-like n=1 Tax=Sphaerodactylus townsendi TaxID=933632 RepID=UPI002026FD44|nr:keratin, type II cytoskeletal 3-like [Sphaerodactylus townsendi]
MSRQFSSRSMSAGGRRSFPVSSSGFRAGSGSTSLVPIGGAGPLGGGFSSRSLYGLGSKRISLGLVSGGGGGGGGGGFGGRGVGFSSYSTANYGGFGGGSGGGLGFGSGVGLGSGAGLGGLGVGGYALSGPGPCAPPGRIHNVIVNKNLLTPLHMEVDPELQRVRVQEREQIKSLNNKFATFIDKVHILQQQNIVLSTQWELLQHQCWDRKSPQNMKSLLQSYMQDMRMLLNTVRGQKEQLTSEFQQLQEVTKEYEERHKEALKKRLAAENEFTELKKGIDTAYKENMDLDVKADLLIEQIVRLRDIYEVERMELQRRVHDGAENTVLMNNHRDLNIDNFLEEVRCQYEDIVQRSKEEVDARCRGKHEELHTMCGRHYEHMHNNHQEIQELTHHILMLKMEIGNLKKKNARLQEIIADSEQRGDHALQDAKEKLHDLEHALQKARDKLTQLQRGFQEQLNDKLALDIEATICRQQLERGGCWLYQVPVVDVVGKEEPLAA